MIRWRYFQNQKYLAVSLSLSFLFHIFILFLIFFPNPFITTQPDFLENQQTEKVLIRLHFPEDQKDSLNQFVSVVQKQSVGNLTKSPPAIHIPGEGEPSVIPGIFSSNKKSPNLNTLSSLSISELLKKVEKKSPKYMTSWGEEPVIQENSQDDLSDLSDSNVLQKGGKAFSRNSKTYQFSTLQEGEPQIGSIQHEWSEFYLGYSDACSTSLKSLFRLVPLVGTDQIVFVTQVFKDGTIRFVDYLQQSPKYPVLDDIGKQMINFSKRIEKISSMKFFLQRNFIQVVVKLAYSQQTGIWTISFYGDHE